MRRAPAVIPPGPFVLVVERSLAATQLSSAASKFRASEFMQ